MTTTSTRHVHVAPAAPDGRRTASAVATALAVLLALLALGGEAEATYDEGIQSPALAPTVSATSAHAHPSATSSDVVVDWSRISFEAGMTDDGFVSFLGARHQAMAHIAMHDALNAIRPRYEQYAYSGRSYGADPVAAAAAAAHDVLATVYPAQQDTLDAELATWLATVPDGPAKTSALTLGAAAAAAIVALREDDGTDVDSSARRMYQAPSPATTSSSRRTPSRSPRTSATRRPSG